MQCLGSAGGDLQGVYGPAHERLHNFNFLRLINHKMQVSSIDTHPNKTKQNKTTAPPNIDPLNQAIPAKPHLKSLPYP